MSRLDGRRARRTLHERRNHRVVLGTIVIVVGLLALLDNLGIPAARWIWPAWPLVFVVAGVLKMQQAQRSGGGRLVGAGLIVAGAAWTAANYGFMHLSFRHTWPLLLIGAGVLVILRGVQRDRAGDATDAAADGASPGAPGAPGAGADDGPAVSMFSSGTEQRRDASRLDAVAVFSGSVVRNDTPDFQGGEVTVAMGGLEVDLRRARMTQPEVVVHVFALFGGVVLQVPPDWTVVVRGTPVLGGMEDKSLPAMEAAHRLVIDGYVIMGGLEVKN